MATSNVLTFAPRDRAVEARSWREPLPLISSVPVESNYTVLRVTAVLVSMLSWHRQGWQGKIHRYTGRTAFYASPSAAKAAAERERVQGTYFQVHEVPGMRLDAPGKTLVALNHHDRAAFSDWAAGDDHLRDEFRAGISLGRVGMWLAPVRWSAWWRRWEGAVLLDIDPSLPLVPAPRAHPTQAWESESLGGQYVLDWDSLPNDGYTARPLHSWVRTFTAGSGEIEVNERLQLLRHSGLASQSKQRRFRFEYC